MDRELVKLARSMEIHESAVWARCVEASCALAGNPLEAVTDRVGPVPLVALRAVDRADLNRVIALGVGSPTRERDLDAICSFYERHGQRNFRIEVTPVSRPHRLAAQVAARGLRSEGAGTFKVWRPTHDPPRAAPSVNVRRLSRADADAFAAISVAAWGAWNTEVSMTAWFGATVGAGGVRHYGVFDGQRLVATGALFFGHGLGWFGFDATHPRYQGRGLRQAISAVRMVDAAAEGCRAVHAESVLPPSRRALRDGWQLLYEKVNYSSVRDEVVVAAGIGPPHRRSWRAPRDASWQGG